MFNNVIFDKIDHRSLAPELTYVDIHYHSCYSDTHTRIKTILKRAKQKNIGVAITYHNEIKGCLEAFNNKEGVLVIPGMEIGCIEGLHILAYFYDVMEMQEFYFEYLETMCCSLCSSRKISLFFTSPLVTLSEAILKVSW